MFAHAKVEKKKLEGSKEQRSKLRKFSPHLQRNGEARNGLLYLSSSVSVQLEVSTDEGSKEKRAKVAVLTLI